MTDDKAPEKVRLDASTICQLRCPTCKTTEGEIDKHLGSGFLKAADFERFLDKNPGIRSVELSNKGEIFLNPEFLELLRIAHERGVALTAQNGVNFNAAKENVIEGLAKYQLRRMTVSIDGASQETYAKYRVGGNFDRVMGNIQKLLAYKEKHQSKFPELIWQFIVFGHNEHELPKAREMAVTLGMRFAPKLSWDDTISPLRDREWVMKELGGGPVTRTEHLNTKGEIYLGEMCLQLWAMPAINFDGKVLGCCVNYWGDFGSNALEGDLSQVLNGDKMQYARKMLKGEAPAREDIPCSKCYLYRRRVKNNLWISPEAITSG